MGVESESDSNLSREFLDIQEVVREIRERTRGLTRSNLAPRRDGFGANLVSAPPPPPPVPNLARSDAFYSSIETGALLAGEMPPMPPTLRAKAGKWLVAIVRRMLFWYIPQVQSHQRASAQAVRELAEALRGIERSQRQWHSSWRDLHRDVTGLMDEIHSIRIRLDAIEESLHDHLTSDTSK